MACLGFFTANAQTSYNLDWYMGIGSHVDLIINQGDIVTWTWGDNAPHTVENTVGNSVETFSSGTLSGDGETYSHTFTVAGDNHYFCGIHGAASMSGTITVNGVTGVEENDVNIMSIYPNPAASTLTLILPDNMLSGQITVFDVVGKKIYSQEFQSIGVFSIDIVDWNSGVYLLEVVSGENSQTERFIKN